MPKISALISFPRVYLSAGKFFLDLGWFYSGGAEPVYGPALLFERIAIGRDVTYCGGLFIKCGEKELAVIGGWSNEGRP